MRAILGIGPNFPGPHSGLVTIIYVPHDKKKVARFACSDADKKRLLSIFDGTKGRFMACWQGQWESHVFDVRDEVRADWAYKLGRPSAPVNPEQFPPYDWGK